MFIWNTVMSASWTYTYFHVTIIVVIIVILFISLLLSGLFLFLLLGFLLLLLGGTIHAALTFGADFRTFPFLLHLWNLFQVTVKSCLNCSLEDFEKVKKTPLHIHQQPACCLIVQRLICHSFSVSIWHLYRLKVYFSIFGFIFLLNENVV